MDEELHRARLREIARQLRMDADAWFDEDGLLGTSRNPTRWSGGNQLLDTAQYYVVLGLCESLTLQDKKNWIQAVRRCELAPGVYQKNPGRPDEITHDDIIGVVCGSLAFKSPFVRFPDEIYERMRSSGGVLSNQPGGKFYFNALVRPWDRIFYRLAQWRCPFVSFTPLFALYVVLHAFLGTKNESGRKIMWLRLSAFLLRPPMSRFGIPPLGYTLVKVAAAVWLWRMRSVWGSISQVYAKYYSEYYPVTVALRSLDKL